MGITFFVLHRPRVFSRRVWAIRPYASLFIWHLAPRDNCDWKSDLVSKSENPDFWKFLVGTFFKRDNAQRTVLASIFMILAGFSEKLQGLKACSSFFSKNGPCHKIGHYRPTERSWSKIFWDACPQELCFQMSLPSPKSADPTPREFVSLAWTAFYKNQQTNFSIFEFQLHGTIRRTKSAF